MKLAHMPYILIVSFLLFVTTIDARPRHHFIWPTGSYHSVENNVAISAHILSETETAELFDGYGKSFIKGRNSIIPYKIEIFNGSEGTIIMHDTDIGLPLVNVIPKPASRGGIIKAGLYGTAIIGGAAIGGIIGVVGGALIAGPMMHAVNVGGVYTMIANNGAIAVVTLSTLFGSYAGARICYSAVGYMYSKPLIKEYQLAEKVAESAMHSSMMIKPNEAREFIVFTSARNLQPSFSLSLDLTSQIKKTTFPVKLDNTDEIGWVAARIA